MKIRSRVGSLVRSISRGIYKAKGHKCSEFVARFIGRARDDSRGLVVFENEIVSYDEKKNIAIKITEAE